MSNVAGSDNVAYVVKGKIVYDEDGNIDYDKSDDTIYYKVYDKDGNEVDGGTPKPIYLKTRRTEFGKVLSDVPIEEYVNNELYPQEQNNIQQVINNGQTNIEQSAPEESVSTDERQEVTEENDNTEFDENGLPFVKTSNGVTDFGYIPEDTGLTPAPIRLSIGDERTGLQHIVDRHGEQIAKAGFGNVVDFVEYVAGSYNTITEGVDTSGEPNGTYLLQVKDKHNNTLYIELSNDGSYWNINSGGVFRKGYGEKNKVVWSASEVQRGSKSATPNTLRSQDEADNQGDPNRTVSDTTSNGKGSINNSNRQEEFYNSLPRNKKGEVDESQMSAEQKIRYAQAEFGQRADLVRDYVAEQSKALSEKIAKLTNKTGKSVAEYKELAALQEDKRIFVDYLNERIQQEQAQATPRQTVEEAAAEREERRAAEKEQREQAIREKEEREGVPDFMQDTPEDARLRGFRLRTGERINRQEPITLDRYNTARRKFTNDAGAVEGGRPIVKRTIIDNAQTKLQPSHRGGRSNIYHFITEAQPKERTDKASRVSAAQIAANINPEEITGGITAYNGSPIANNRLEVIQGNNRAEALRLMYEEYPKSAEAYKQYLIDNAEDYGMSADEVRTMREPIAVDIYEGTDDNAILLGQYTQQDVESGGVHRINPSGVIKHLKSQNMLDRFITGLLKGVDEENTVSDVIAANLRDVLPILDKTGAISMTQRQGFFDERGDVTSGAIDDFKGVLTHLITEGGYANINSDFLNLPESAKTALYLQTYRAVLNKQDGQEILDNIQDSILLYTLVFGKNNKGKVGADEARREVMSWLMTAQPDFNAMNEDGTYPLVDMREKFSNFAAELAILYKSTNLRSSKDKGRGLYTIWDDFYNLLEGKGDLFTTGEKKSLRESINENFNIDYVPIRQNEHNTLGSRGEASRAGRRGSDSELGVGERAETGARTADGRGRAEADIAEVGKSRDVRYMTTDEINDRFNKELQQQIDGTLPKGHVYSLGMPNDILRSAGFPNVPIELSASHLEKKSIAAQHPFELKEIKSLVKALQDPMAVFAYGDKEKSQNVIVEIQHEGKNFVVGIHFNRKRGSAEISSIRGLYPKDNAEWLNWISQGKLLYVNKEKIQILIDQQRRNLADVEYLDLNYVAKVIKDFDNPTLSGEKNEETRLKASKRKARGATTEKLEELVTLLKKTGFADVKTGEDFYNALAEIEDKEGSRFMTGKQATEADERAIADETADIKAKTISDGTFMKAPNGKDTNLTERQWLQVRTKAFKKWFGDWENAYKLELIENLQPIGVDNKGLSRERAEEEYKKIGTSKTNRYDNRRIEFVNNAFGKIARHKNSALILDIIPQLNDLFESAIPIYFEEEREPLKSTNIVGSHNYLGKVRVNDEDYYVRITAQELTPSWKQNEKQGKSNFHNMAVSDIAIYDESGSSVTAKDYSIDNDNRNRFVDAKLQHFFETAREARENSSKVVDENGEPMVVYHGTNNEFYTFEEREGYNSELLGGERKVKRAGFFFSPNKNFANNYGRHNLPVFLNIKNLFNFKEHYYYTNSINETLSELFDEFVEYADEQGINLYNDYPMGYDYYIISPDDIWRFFDDELGSVFKRFVQSKGFDGVWFPEWNSDVLVNNFMLFSPAQIKSATDNIGTFDVGDEDIRYMRPNGTVLGFVKGNTIYLNPDEVSLNTPIHEFGHLWVSQVKEHFPDLWARGKELFLESDYLRKVQADENYRHLDLDGQIDEAMARAIGDRGEQELDKTLLEKILDWIAEVWDKIGGVFGIDNLTSEQISNLTLQDFTDMATSELLSGQNLTERVNGNRGGATRYNTADETADIKARAIADGTFMKAPNGKDTNLTERQWLQVRTKAFKKWFGDWEKTARIEKLKKTKPIEITGEEYKGKYELNVKSGHKWVLDNLRGTYTVKDTGEKVNLSRVSANEITSHGEREDIHLKSFAVIPQMIENAIFIDETDNYKGNNKYDKYKYYVVGLNVDGVPYTARIVVGEKNGKTYYDHELTQIEKGTIIDSLNGTTTSVAKNANAFSEYKDNRLFSLLQENSSKVVDENGEPKVVYHGTTNGLLVLVPQLTEKREDGSSWINDGKMREIADDYIQKHKMLPFTSFKQKDKVHKGTIEEFPNFWFTSDRKVAQTYAYTMRRTTSFKSSEDEEIDEEGNLVEWVSKRKTPIAFYEVLKEGQRFDELNEEQLAEIKSIADKKGWILPFFPNRFWAYKILIPKDKLIDLRNREYEGYEFDYEGIKNRKEPYEDIYGEEFGYTGSFFLNIRTGNEVDFKGKKWFDTVRGKELNAYIRTSFKKSKDGFIAKNIIDPGSMAAENPANDYVVFSPAQIKSATDNIGTFNEENEDIRYSVEGADYFVNERFNEQLEHLTEANADSTIFYLGEPSAEMLAVGVKDSPLKLYGNKLQSKAKKHGFDVKDVRDLPEAIHDPIAIFEGAEDGSFAILTELSVGDNNVLATLSVGKGNDVDFNIVSSVYGKYNKNVVSWINKGKTLYVNKEKALDYLRISAPIAEAQDKGELNLSASAEKTLDWFAMEAPKASSQTQQELITATKVIENFENPPINEKKVIDDTTNDMVRYSIKASEQLNKEDEVMGETKSPQTKGFWFCDPEGIRTPDPQLRRLLLYPAELPDLYTTFS